MLPTADDVLAAANRIAGHVVHTPMLRNAELDRRAGTAVLVKPECLQRTGSFKLRGAVNALRQLAPGVRAAGVRAAGVVAYSSGNHGQAVASAAAGMGVAATIYMPTDAPRVKVDGTRRWGAEILTFDRATTDRDALLAAHAERTGATRIPPFDHPHVIAGQGTLALELAADAAAAGLWLDALLVCTGGGGMVAGCALAMAAVSPGTAVHAVEPEGADDTMRSLASGQRERNAPGGSALCDALLSPMPGEMTFAINRALLAGGVVVGEAQVLEAMRFAFTHLKLVVEPGGAVALAAVLAGGFAGKGPVGVVISGGNVDAPVFAAALSPG